MQNMWVFKKFIYINTIFFFLGKSFNLWHSLLMIILYHQTKTPISFLCRQGLNHRSLIQLSETLPIKLTGTHINTNIYIYAKI